MSAVLESHVAERQVSGATWLAVLQLGWREGRRMVLSPVLLLVFGFFMLMAGVEAVAEATLSLPSRSLGVRVPLLRLRSLRRSALLHLVPPGHVVGPAVEGRGPAGGVAAVASSAGCGDVSRACCSDRGWSRSSQPAPWRSSATTSCSPMARRPSASLSSRRSSLIVVGGGLFAVMVATWLRFPGSLPLGFVVLVFGTVWMLERQNGHRSTRGRGSPRTSASYEWSDAVWTRQGSHAWHAVVPRRALRPRGLRA